MAVGTVTAVPIRPPALVDSRRAGVAMTLAPLAVLPLGICAGLLIWLGTAVAAPPLVLAALTIGLVALGSRAIHLDGLADTADGLTASYNRAKALEIMTRGNTGPAGAATLVLVLLVQTASLASIVDRPWAPVLVGTLVLISRGALAGACVRGIAAARPGGLGATVAGTVSRPVAAVVGVLLLAAGYGVAVLGEMPWWQGPLAVLVAGCAVAALLRRCVVRLGGVTGDVLGACVEVAFAGLLVVMSAG
ncbi:adenosylcobinamide-GDP ribazoletransferase [Nakamurella silvestris]|nr:adenosylcobinamide-GDP ribazoletransferase [Nakamurella silvestris]